MARRDETPRDLLFGLLALQVGLIDQDQLISAFGAWSRNKGKSLAEILVERGVIDDEGRAILKAMAEKQLKLHGGDTEKSLAAVAAGPSTREKLAALGDTDLTASVAFVGSQTPSPDSTATMSVGTATAEGQRFRVLRPHAQGGLGAVFVALDGELNREVALKQILDHHADNEISRTRFLIEAEITGGLEHPGIVPVYGLGHHNDGRPYYAMRFIRGDSLKEAIAAFHSDESLKKNPGKKSLALRNLLRRFVDVCNAIDYAHGRGILHRDLKPGNVIVGKYGETLVVDWGLAKPMGRAEPSTSEERTLMPSSSSGSAETLPGSAIGTPSYMSPEQAVGDLEKLGPRSDVYSLGATLYCLLTGRPPFQGDDLGTVLREVQKGSFPPPREMDPSIEKALEAICLKAMALKIDDRHASARALAEDIERWAADEPTSAWAEPSSVKARRWMRRNRTAVAVAAVATLATLFGTAAVLAVQTQANAQLKKSNEALNVANEKERKANAALTQANADLAAAKDREAARFKLAMDAIGVFHNDVAGDFLLQQDEFVPLRNKLLQGAADFYKKLESDLAGQNDRQALQSIGRAYYELGKLAEKLGSIPEAIARLRQSVDIRRRLAEGTDPGDESRLDLAWSLLAVGLAMEGISGNQDQMTGLPIYQEAAAIFEGLLSTSRPRTPLLIGLAEAQSKCAYYIGVRDQKAGVELARRTVEFLRREIHEASSDSELQLKLANALLALNFYATQSDEKIDAYRRYLETYQTHVRPGLEGAFDRNEMASTYYGLALLYRDTGRLDDQESAIRRMIELRESLVRLSPGVSMFQNNLGHGLTQLGLFQAGSGQFERALATFGRARDILERASLAQPHSGWLVNNFNAALLQSGRILDNLGRTAEALELLNRGLAFFEQITSADPANRAAEVEKAILLAERGRLRSRIGELNLAVEDYDHARSTLERSLAADPSNIQTRSYLALLANSESTVLLQLGRLGEARVFSRKSLDSLETLSRERPGVVYLRGFLGRAYHRSGQVREAEGDFSGATADFRRSIETLESMDFLDEQNTFWMACSHAALAGLAGRPGSGITALEGETQANKAVDVVKKAIAKGFVSLGFYRSSTALDSVRSRPDFQALMQDLSFPARPFLGGEPVK